ncbi:MAG: TonB family protein [Betaproteobacteria bacterium]|nr:TonB family protein [Betaproteobacteria bacterium]MDE2131672.1 TonB family protein [Betaproteobacteria bacterium]MDE2212098.1 TonB family protein [Betaproteobacteria bacterium]MDE2353750.1 TonB family protein [Betaproteobacteria bacterium]
MSASHGRRLGLALGLSILLHGILLSIFPLQRGKGVRVPDTVLNIELEQAAPSPAPLTVPPAVPDQGRVPAHVRAEPRVPAAAESTPLSVPAVPASEATAKPQEDLRLRSLQMIRKEVVDPFAGQRVRRLSAQTRDEVFGPYEEAYRQKVEQVGSVNYPPPVAGRRLYGVVRLTATIHQDGSLALVEIMQSSGSPDLDDAARRIVQMAAPFQPFTPAMRARADLVSITRSFNFIRAGEAVQSQ